jgi:hypothetical protein
VLVSYYYRSINDYIKIQERLVLHNNSVLNYVIQSSEISSNDKLKFELFDNGIISHITKRDWGLFQLLNCSSSFKNDTISKTVLLSRKESKSDIALYVTNYDVPIKLIGECKIIGLKKIPKGYFENAYLNGIENHHNLYGVIDTSSSKLPSLSGAPVIPSETETISYESLEKNSQLFNSFKQTTKLLDVSELDVLEDISIRGNIIIVSNSNLIIKKSALIEDVLLVANKNLTIEAGFKGNVHIIGKKQVEIQPEVQLKYPSSIYMNNDKDSVVVKLSKNSKIIGGVVISGNTYKGSLKRKFILEKDAIVIGSLYNYGTSQLEGKVIGSVYTDRLSINTTSLKAENTMLNTVIDHDSLPKNFVKLPLFTKRNMPQKYEIIKTF